MYRIFLVASSLFVANLAYAGCSGSFCSDVTIEQIYVKANGGHLIQTSGNESSLDPCVAYGSKHLELQNTDYKDDLLSVLLAAQASGASTGVGVNSTGSKCVIEYVQINRS